MSDRCRILYHHRIRAEDGQAVHVREMIAALRRAGHEVLECALVPKASGPDRDAARGGGFWQRLRLPRAATEVLEILYNRRGRAMLAAAARRFRPHFVYERHALHCRVGLDVARRLDVPLLLEVNSPHCAEMEALGLLRFPKLARSTERAVLAGADRVLPVTRVLGGILEEAGARRSSIRVIGNAAQPERYGAKTRAAAKDVRGRLGLAPDAFALGFVGYVRQWHRLDLVLEAMARPALSGVHLVVVGIGPALEELLAAAGRRGMEERVHSAGDVPPVLLPAHVMALEAAVIPAINAYASPLKLFDSLAAGVVTVAPRQPNLEEVVTDGEDGVLFEQGSADDLAARLEELVADRERASSIGRAGRESLLRHDRTWDGNARRIVRIWQEVARP